jgi:hypothetical protein
MICWLTSHANKKSVAKLKEESRDRVVDDAQEEEHDEEDDGI